MQLNNIFKIFCWHQWFSIIIIFFILFTLTVHAQQSEQDTRIKTVTIAAHTYPPYYNQNGKGLLADIYQAIFNELNIELKLKILPIKRGVIELMEGEVDAYSPGDIFLNTAQKKQVINENIFNVIITWMYYLPATTNKINYQSLADITGMKTAVIMNSPYLKLYDKYKINYVKTETPNQLVKMIRFNRVKYSEVTYFSGLFLANKLYPKEKGNFDFYKRDILFLGLSFLKSKQRSQKVRRLIRKGLKIIIKNGKYIKVLEFYWGKNNIPKEVLPPALKHLGKSKISKPIFHKKNRNNFGKIIY